MWHADAEELLFINKSEVLFLGRPSADSPPTTPKSRRSASGGGSSSSSKKQPGASQVPVLAHAMRTLRREPDDQSSPWLYYFEAFVKTSGGGLQPTGSVGVGLAELPSAEGAEQLRMPPADGTAAASSSAFVHFHNSGRRFVSFPRPALRTAGKVYGPQFATGDTVGCGWLANGDVFFTVNGRHLGVAQAEVWGRLCPAVDFDSPGACLELSFGGEGERRLRYVGDGAPRGSERWLNRMSRVSRGLTDPRSSVRGLFDDIKSSTVGVAAISALQDGKTALQEGSNRIIAAASPDRWEAQHAADASAVIAQPSASASAADEDQDARRAECKPDRRREPPQQVVVVSTSGGAPSHSQPATPSAASSGGGTPDGGCGSPPSLAGSLGSLCLGAASSASASLGLSAAPLAGLQPPNATLLSGLQAHGLAAQRSAQRTAQRSFLRALGHADGSSHDILVYEESSSAAAAEGSGAAGAAVSAAAGAAEGAAEGSGAASGLASGGAACASTLSFGRASPNTTPNVVHGSRLTIDLNHAESTIELFEGLLLRTSASLALFLVGRQKAEEATPRAPRHSAGHAAESAERRRSATVSTLTPTPPVPPPSLSHSRQTHSCGSLPRDPRAAAEPQDAGAAASSAAAAVSDAAADTSSTLDHASPPLPTAQQALAMLTAQQPASALVQQVSGTLVELSGKVASAALQQAEARLSGQGLSGRMHRRQNSDSSQKGHRRQNSDSSQKGLELAKEVRQVLAT